MFCTCWDVFRVNLLFETSCYSLPRYNFEVVSESCSQKTPTSSVVRGFWPPQKWASMSWKWASLRWVDPSSLSLIIIQESIILTFIWQLSLVISRLQASPLPWTHWGRTSIALDSKLPCKPFRCVSCKSRRWSVLLYEALSLVSRFWFCQRRLLQTKNPLDSSDLFPLLISLPSFNLRPDIPAHSKYWCVDIWDWKVKDTGSFYQLKVLPLLESQVAFEYESSCVCKQFRSFHTVILERKKSTSF